MTKKDVNKKLNALRKAGYQVYHLSSNTYMRGNAAGLPDHIIVGHGKVIFIEDKLTPGEKLSEQQEAFRAAIANYPQAKVFYHLNRNEDDVDILYKIAGGNE
jgi:biotin operon repressor